jgi:NADH dehydrogenase
MSAFQTRVVIVGADFAGLSAAKALRRVPVQVTVVDQHDYHTFKPFLYQVATALLGADASAYPTRGEVRRLANVSFRLGTVTGSTSPRRRSRQTVADCPTTTSCWPRER